MKLKVSNTVAIALSAGAVILVIVLVVYGSKFIKRLFAIGEKRTFQYEPTPTDPNGVIRPDFFSTPYVTRLIEVLYNSMWDGSPRCDAYKKLMGLTDNEFITVLNDYYATTGSTLRSDMDRTWQSGCSVFFTQWDERVYDRMDRLHIIG